MKIKKFLSLATLTVAALAGSAVAYAEESITDHIVDIRVMDMVGRSFGDRSSVSGTPRCAPDNPVIAGEDVYIRVLMQVSNAVQAQKFGDNPKTWKWVNLTASLLDRPALGIRIGGRNEWAEYSEEGPDTSWQHSGELMYDDAGNETTKFRCFTVFYFKYTVKPGDMGLPVVLLNSNLEPAEGSLTTNEYAIRYVNAVGYEPKYDIQNEDGVSIGFRRADPTTVVVDYPGSSYPINDFNLRKEGLYIKTVDFDNDYAVQSDDIWREINLSGYKGNDPSLEVGSPAKSTQNLYIWSDNQDVALPDLGLDGIDIRTLTIDDKPVKVLTVQLREGEKSARFKLKAAPTSKINDTAKIYMSPNDKSVYDPAGTLVETAVCRTVKVGETPAPGVQIRIDGKTVKDVKAGTKYDDHVAKLVVSIVNDDPNRNASVKVKLTAKATGETPEEDLSDINKIYNKGYLRITKSEGFDWEAGKTFDVTIPVHESSVECFVYATGASADTEDGIRFTPEVPGGEIELTDSPSAVLKVIRAGDEGIVVDKVVPPASSELSMSKSDTKRVTVTFSDTYKSMFVDKAYTFYLEDASDGTIYATVTKVAYRKATPEGYCYVDIKLDQDAVSEGKTYNAVLYGVSADGSTTTRIPYTLKVIDGPQVMIKQAGESLTIGEGETMAFNLYLNQKASSKKYIFVKGATEKDGKLFESNQKTQGAPLSEDLQHVNGTRAIKFLDGDKEVSIKAYTGDTIDDPEDVDLNWAEGDITITVTNKPPVLTNLKIGGTPITASEWQGKTLEDEVPMGVAKSFVLTKVDDVDLDLLAEDDPATEKDERFHVKWIIDGSEYEEMGDPKSITVTHKFASKTAEGKKGQLVECYLKDKDMLDYPTEPNFRCYVKVAAKPFVSLSTSAIGNLFNETAQSVGSITVALSEPASARIEVLLTIQQPATGLLKLRTADGSVEDLGGGKYNVIFESGREKNILIAEMDGTNDTIAGLDVNAEVTTETPNPDGVPWKDYYSKAEAMVVRIQNVAPQILRPTDAELAYTNEHASAGVPYKISYGVTDVKADLEKGIDVSITVDGTPIAKDKYVTPLKDTSIQEAEVSFSGEGVHVVDMTFTDKDGMPNHATMIFLVQQSKRLLLRAHGPASKVGSTGGYSAKYGGQSGLGSGRVFAGEDGPQKIESFVHSYSFNVVDSSVMASAFGYKAVEGLKDDGTLDSAEFPNRDRGIDKYGNWSSNKTITDWYVYADDDYTTGGTHKGKLGLDSFVYGWACNNSVSSKNSDSGTESFVLTIGAKADFPIPLPDSSDNQGGATGNNAQQKSIPVQNWEVIFSSELLKGDNCGDINGDGIPDAYMMKYRFDVLDDNYQLAGNDLRDLNFTDEENPQPYCVEGDYLPAVERGVYTKLIPGLPEKWGDETNPIGEPFTPILKIRGFGDSDCKEDGRERISNLNDAPLKPWVGLTELKPERVYTNPKEDKKSTLSYVEWLAWSEYKAANPAATEKDWSPENPTDPTKSDSDRDGMTDGYEYYMWYMAHIGWVENYGTPYEVHKYLTGRRYDERNPGEGTVIPSWRIAEAFDPNSGNGNKLADTDNDGLPDILEFELGTNPVDFDTDGDGLPDGWEIMIGGTDPLLANTTTGLSDAARNFDGDAMAFSTTELEAQVKPAPLYIRKLYTFAVRDEGGDTDGVQWYSLKPEDYAAEALKLKVVAEAGKGTLFKVGGKSYIHVGEVPTVTTKVGGKDVIRLAADLMKDSTFFATNATVSVEGEDVEATNACLTPTYFTRGTILDEAVVPDTPYAEITVSEAKEGCFNAAWLYGASMTFTDGNKYGMLAVGRYQDPKAEKVLAELPANDREVAYLHYIVYQEFGFDPRTAWSDTTPVAPRWGNGDYEGLTKSGAGGYAGTATRTRKFYAYDEFLVHSFFVNNGTTLAMAPRTLSGSNIPAWAEIWGAFTTNPQGPNEPDREETDHYYGRLHEVTNGADTDGDGVPDGWELYVMAGPKEPIKDKLTEEVKDLRYVFAPAYAGFRPGCRNTDLDASGASTAKESYWSPFVPAAADSNTDNPNFVGKDKNDKLTQLQEFAGTDSCAHYAEVSTTIKRPEEHVAWINKFFPTDPWNMDTDGDGMKDGDEFTPANGRATFVYEGNEDDGKLWCIPGGGLNPCTLDTDMDGLPDPWEAQYAGKTLDAENPKNGFIDGMDGTVKDAATSPKGISRDYDKDGLENWQEYMTGAMRCWRYDDPYTDWTFIAPATYLNADGQFDVGHAVDELYKLGKIKQDPKDGADGLKKAIGEFWYRTLFDAKDPLYNPYLISGHTSAGQYWTRVSNGWDINYVDVTLSKQCPDGNFYFLFDRVNGKLLKDLWKDRDWWLEDHPILRYPGCSPICADSDGDGMDDYYELFHGLNPLLGSDGGIDGISAGGADLVRSAYYSGTAPSMSAWGVGNWWTPGHDQPRKGEIVPRGTGYDFVVYPWMNGDMTADPDGDDIGNQEEAIMAKFSSAAYRHTDPTPLWMTDSTYPESLVRMFYSMPRRQGKISFEEGDATGFVTDANGDKVPGFEYNGNVFYFRDAVGFRPPENAKDSWHFPNFVTDPFDVATQNTEDGGMSSWMFDFEENEGYDTDHDGSSDSEEISGKVRGKTDPQDFDSPGRRQAMYFQGEAAKGALQTLEKKEVLYPAVGSTGTADPAFQQFTVECWVMPEAGMDAADSEFTVVERPVWTGDTSAGDERFLRCNFRLSARNGKWCAKFDTSGRLDDGFVRLSSSSAIEVGKWTHLSATYDGKTFVLYINGVNESSTDTNYMPVWDGASLAVTKDEGWYKTYSPWYYHCILVGASMKNEVEFGSPAIADALDLTKGVGWDGYCRFFKGYVDEVRIWDGARTQTEVSQAYKKRFTKDDVLALREAFYADWSNGKRRYEKDADGNLQQAKAELRFHFTFDSIFAAENPAQIAKAPAGFENGPKAPLSRPDGYEVGWWSKVLAGYEGTVYNNPAWVPWLPNTVTHLPMFDLTTLDSLYWSEDFTGTEPGQNHFARSGEPWSRWTQVARTYIGQYISRSTRHWLVYTSPYASADMVLRYSFANRNLVRQGSDLLPLGGAYAKYCVNMWDDQGASTTWEISGADSNADGLPDWWAEYADENYRPADMDPSEQIGWDTIIEYYGLRITAGEAYLRDLAKGSYVDANGKTVIGPTEYVQTYDENRNGVPEWWEDMYGIRGESGLDDHDHDGLPNYVEYLLSEVFAFEGVVFDPTKRCSIDPNTPDYFYKVGNTYVGEIFTDFDQVEDLWEDAYDGYASRLEWDAYADGDADGWSNRSESRAGTRPDTSATIIIDGEQLTEYPEPLVNLSLSYAKARGEAAAIVMQAYSGDEISGKPDATWLVSGSNSTVKTLSLGANPNRVVELSLGPCRVVPDTVSIEFRDPNAVTVETNGASVVTGYGWTGWVSEVVSSEDVKHGKLRRGIGEQIGTIDYEDAKLSLDLTKLQDYLYIDLESNVISYYPHTEHTYVKINMAESYVRVRWQSQRVSDDSQWRFSLAKADAGHLREGLNTFVAFVDTNGNGVWDPGEAYGVKTGVDIGWSGTSIAMELTDTSAVTPRVVLWAGASQGADSKGGSSSSSKEGGSSVNADRVRTVAEIYQELEDAIYAKRPSPAAVSNELAQIRWRETNVIEEPVLGSSGKVRIRVARWLVNGLPLWRAGVPSRVVFDRYCDLSERTVLTEADFLSQGELDLDWANLAAETARRSISEIDYLIVVGEGQTGWQSESDSNIVVKAFSQVISRRFGEARVLPTPVSPSKGASPLLVTEARPTFKWNMAESDDCGYTAFRVQVLTDDGKNVVYDSGKLPAPARDIDGNYSWKSSLCVGDKTTLGKEFENGTNYQWKVAMYNAKYATDAFSEVGSFRTAVQTNGYVTGSADVAVRYFGPKESYEGRTIRVQAFTSADFTGDPVAAGYVADPDAEENGVSVTGRHVTANCKVIGIPKGTYYFKAFIDSNTNGVCDVWETMGYLCKRDLGVADYLVPVPMAFDTETGKGDLAVIYMEDADTDGDRLPDAWEYAKYGSLTEKGIELLSESPAGEILLNTDLTGVLSKKGFSIDPTAGIAGRLMLSLNNAGLMALALGAETSVGQSFGEAIRGVVSPELVKGGVKITALEMVGDKVIVQVAAETAQPQVDSPLARLVDSDGTLWVTCRVNWKMDLLDTVWTTLKVTRIKVGAEAAEIDLSDVAPTGGSGYYTVELKAE